MALPLPPILTPQEVAFLCEMESVTVVPRQRLDSLELLGGPTETLRPPHRADLPLWLALLLKRQRRANILPPPWMRAECLEDILKREIQDADNFSDPPANTRIGSGLGSQASAAPPFLHSSTADAEEDHLPYHWLEIGEILLDACSDDIPAAGQVRGLLRDLREVRMAKMRTMAADLEGGGVLALKGVGAMEVAEGRAFVGGAIDALRKIGSSREVSRRQRQGEEDGEDEDEDEEMGF